MKNLFHISLISAGFIFGLNSCGPNPRLIPDPEPSPELSFNLSLGEIGFLLSDEEYKLRMKIFPVVDGERQESGASAEYVIDPNADSQEIRIPSLTIGTKDFVAEIVSASLLTVGEGEFRYTIRPGLQTMPDGLIIRMIESFGQPTTEQIKLKVKGNYKNPNLITYLDIKPYLLRKCVICHNSFKTKGDVDLSVFPFRYPNDFEDLEDLVYQIVDTMSTTGDGQMPPEGDRPSESSIEIFERWIDDGLQETGSESVEISKAEISWRYMGESGWKPYSPMGGESGVDFAASLSNVIVGKSMDLKFNILGSGSVELVEKEFPAIGIRKDAILEYSVDFQIEKPTNVKIPIEIEIEIP